MKAKIVLMVILTWLVLIGVSFGANAQYSPDTIITSSDGFWLDSRAKLNLSSAVTAIGSDVRDLVIAGSESVSSDLIIPATTHVRAMRGCAITVSAGKTLTINDLNIDAGDNQIFFGSGNIDFAEGAVVRSTWFVDFEEAVAETLNDSITLIVAADDTLIANLAIGDSVTLKWEAEGSIINISSGTTLSNVNGIIAGNYPILGGTGNISGEVEQYINSSWFSTVTSLIDATAYMTGLDSLSFNSSGVSIEKSGLIYYPTDGASTIAINSAIESEGYPATIKFTFGGSGVSKAYILSSDVTFSELVTLEFENGAKLVYSGGIADMSALNHPIKSSWFASLEDLQESNAKHNIIDDAWTISSGVTFDQAGTVIEFYSTGAVSFSDNSIDAIVVSGASSQIIKPSITFTGIPLRDGNGGAMIRLDSADHCIVKNARLNTPHGTGIYINESDYCIISENTIIGGVTESATEDVQHYGIRTRLSDSITIDNNVIIGDGTNCTAQAITIAGSSLSSVVSGNHVVNAWDEGIYVASGYNHIITDNYIYQAGLDHAGGLKVDGNSTTNGSIIANNIVDGGSSTLAQGIQIADPYFTVIEGNEVYNRQAGPGVFIFRQTAGDIEGVTVKGNIIRGGTTLNPGVLFGSASGATLYNCIISENIIQDLELTKDTKGIEFLLTTPKKDVIISDNIIDTVGSTGISFLSGGTGIGIGNLVIKDNHIIDVGQNTASPGISLNAVNGASVISNIIDGDGVNMTYGLNIDGVCGNLTALGNEVSGYATGPYNDINTIVATDISCDVQIVKFGTVAASTTEGMPVFIGTGKNGSWIVDCEIINGSTLSAGNPNYETFQLYNYSTSGVATQINTNSAGDNISLSVSTSTSMAATDGISKTHATVANNKSVHLIKTPSGSGVGTDQMIVKIKTIAY